MQLKTIETFKYSELSDAAKAKARGWFRNSDEFTSGDEYLESIKCLTKHFGGEIKDYEIDWSNSTRPSWMKFDMPDTDEQVIELSLKELGTYDPETLKGTGECKLTGVCYDEDAIDGFRIAYMRDGERDLDKLMQAAFKTWIDSAHKEYEYRQSDEAVAEGIEANEYDFTVEGKRSVTL
jgi:hypothetical protein